MRRYLLLLTIMFVSAGCNFELGQPDSGGNVADPPADRPASATALPADIISAADAEYLLLTNIYQRASPSVVNVESLVWNDDGSIAEARRGSGFVYDRQGHIITNAHLVNNVDSISVTLGKAYVLAAELLGADSFSDLAVLKVDTDPERLASLRIGESSTVKVGQRAISIGNPFGLNSSMTSGIVSGLGRTLPSAELIDAGAMPGYDNPSIIQIDAIINPGNSGGPLLDSQGLVIGITTAMRSDSGRFQGIGFAVPAGTMRRVIPDLIEHGHVEYSWMGISVMREDGGYGVAGLGDALDLPVERGVLLRGVAEGSPAQLAGLRGGDATVDVRGEAVCAGGDLIVAINDYYFDDLDALMTYLVQNTRPGDEIELLTIRDKRNREVTLTLKARPADDSLRTIDCHTAQ